MAKKTVKAKLSNNPSISTGRGQNYKGGYQAATDVSSRYGRNPSNGQFSNKLRGDGGKVGRQGRTISRRQRYYDMRVAFGLAGG